MRITKCPPGIPDGYSQETGLLAQLEELALMTGRTRKDGLIKGNSFNRREGFQDEKIINKNVDSYDL